MTVKPPYKIPLMPEIKQIPWNGFNVISTFSGCGGSSLGYKMAGYRVLWANEFIPAAQDTYIANHKDTFLNRNDIRQVTPEDIFKETGLSKGELDIFDGSPPCAAFSTAGKREAGWGKVKKYSDTVQRVDDLFFEYTRLLKGLKPKTFVAENVSGLVKGTAKGYFKEILKTLINCGYNVKAKVLDASWLGVPQARQRLIFIGVREDLKLNSAFPTPLSYQYTVRDALPDILAFQQGAGDYYKNNVYWKDSNSPYKAITASPAGSRANANLVKAIHDTSGRFSLGDVTDRPAPTVTAQGTGQLFIESGTRLSNCLTKEYDNVKIGKNSEKYFSLMRPYPDKPCPTVTQLAGSSAAGVVHPYLKRKFTILELKRICAFPDDFILTGTYAQQWERLGRAVPPVMMYHIAKTIQTEILERLK
jgi:DNA (cytosine-5)-methyltransferase 1